MILIVLNSYSCFPCLSRKLCRNPSTTFSHIPVTHRYRLIDKEAHKPKTSFDRITSSVVRANKKITFYYFIGKSHTTALAGEYCTSVMYSSPSIMRLMLPSSALELDLVCHLRRQPVAHCPPPAANPAHHCQSVISMTVSADNIRWSLQQQRRRRRVSAAVVSAITLQDGNSVALPQRSFQTSPTSSNLRRTSENQEPKCQTSNFFSANFQLFTWLSN